jgi:hypothetical protein
MRARALGLIVASSVIVSASAGYAKQCPADPFKASTALWNWGELRTGEVRTGVHPCGRKITCIGGRFDPLVRRSCHWD